MEMRCLVFLVATLAVLGPHVGGTTLAENYEAMVSSIIRSSGSMQPDLDTGARVAAMAQEGSNNSHPEEMGSYMEGDIMMFHQADSHTDRVENPYMRWPEGIVPYVMADSLNLQAQLTIKNAMAAFNKYTCVRFVPRTSQRDFVLVQNTPTGCWSELGKRRGGGQQVLNIQTPGCDRQGIVMHELMHTLGILHEQSRADRDQFVHINREHIYPGKEGNFQKHDQYTGLGTEYDYGSLMHYSMAAFSSDGVRTIVPAICDNANFGTLCDNLLTRKIGQRFGFSPLDVKKINTLYDCEQKK